MSHSTVSRALRGSRLVNQETRERIRRVAQEMGYMPDEVARSLQMRRTGTLGLVVTSIADPFFVDVVQGVEATARVAGLSVFLNSSHNDPEQEIHVIETFHRRRVDAIIVASSRVGTCYEQRLARIRVPVVFINSQAESAEARMYSVAVDDRAGAIMAVNHLLELGHRRIGYVGASDRPKSNRRRLDGYQEAMQAVGISPDKRWKVTAMLEGREPQYAITAARDLLPSLLSEGVTALFCYNDLLAVGALLACQEIGGRVPDDLSVIGFDNIDLAQYVTPRLSTIHQPKQEMGQRAVEIVLDMLDDKEATDYVFQPSLRIRGSTAPPQGTCG